ncbi:MAG: gliding motility-associated C-terminal domain-containing protein, partial [Taibaiella sp.]|nr:gliding motility-associated C-terminal domain-containing protein [Taibaiella sp.]
FKLGDLNPGECTSLPYAYILRKADLDAAFASTKAKWNSFGDTNTYVTGDTSIVCKNSIITMNIVNGGCHDWSWTSSTGNYIFPTTGTTVNVQVDSTPVHLQAIGKNGSCLQDTINMTIIPTIVITPVVSDIHYCIGNTAVPLKAIASPSVTLRWYTSDPADTGSTVAPTPPTTAIGTFTYYVEGHFKGCTSARLPIVVTVSFPPPPLVVSSNGPLCLGEQVNLSATPIPGSKYFWSGPNGYKSNIQNPVIPVAKATDSGLYTLVDSFQGCPTQTATVNLLVDNVFAKIVTNRPAACIQDNLLLNFAGNIPDTNSTIQWNFAGGRIVKGDNTGSSKGPYTVSWDSLGNKLVTVRVQNWRCISQVTDTIPVVFAPTVSFDLPKIICVGDTIGVKVADYSLTNANAFIWDFNGATEISAGSGSARGNYQIAYHTPGQKILSLSIDYGICIRDPFLDTVTVRPLPDARITGISRNDICGGDTATLTAVLYPNYKYSWSPVQFFSVAQLHEGSNVITGAIAYSGNVYLTARDQYNCVATDSFMVQTEPCCEVTFPSAFTPNGDGRNDVFKPITAGNHHVRVLRVVNRYGQTVFESNVEKDGWDGRHNGVPQDMGTYYYYFSYECNGRVIEEKGDLTLIR